MTERTRARPTHVRRRFTVVAATAALATSAVGLAMISGGHALDPWTAALGASLALVGVSLAQADLLPRRSDRQALDEVDPETGVGNARAVLALLDREAARASAYGSVFSVAVLELDRVLLAGLHPRRAHRTIVDLVRGVATDVRVGDRVCRVSTSDRELVVVVLPDTGATGAHTFAERVLAHARRHLLGEGLPPHGHVRTEVLSHPEDVAGLRRLRRRVEVLEGTEALIRDVPTQALRPRRRVDPPVVVPDHEAVGTPHD